MKKFLIIIVSIILFNSCEKELDIHLPKPDVKLVVEGWIENGEYPIVIISRNSSYFAPIDTNFLMDSLFITNALVVVSDGFINDTRKPTIDIGAFQNGAWPIIFYKGSKLIGTVNTNYTLYIEAEGEIITGQTTIPDLVSFDSLWWKPEIGTGDTLGFIHAMISDNPAERNYYRLFSKRIGRDYNFIPITASVYDDLYFNGLSFEYVMMRGEINYDDEDLYLDPEFGKYKKGDTVLVKLSSIDKSHYDFWRTITEDAMAGGNPFTNPVTIRHNVNGALGVFGGYGSTIDTVIIQ